MPPITAPISRPVLSTQEHQGALARSIALCGRITQTQAKNFYYGLRTTPSHKRDALYAIYAWMRLLDDLVDEPQAFATFTAGPEALHPAGECTSLGAFIEASQRAIAGQQVFSQHQAVGHNTIWPALAHTLATQPIDPAWMHAMIDGVLADQHQREFETVDELLAYCHSVGGTVGLCCTAVWGLRAGSSLSRSEALAKANHRGQAFQIINILRDVAKDASFVPSRVYVPKELLTKHGVACADLLAWRNERACACVVQDLVRLARKELEASAGLERALEPSCGAALWTMTRIYTGILLRIEQSPRSSVLPSPVRVPGAIKLGYALASTMLPRVVVRVKAW